MTKNNIAVFLDVDGVINSLNHLFTHGDINFDSPTFPYKANGYTVWVPDYMSELIQSIHKSTDLYWLTTWREEANNWISPILAIPNNIPVITDSTRERSVSWKFGAARPVAQRLHEQGQKIYWIEDFGAHLSPSLTEFLTYVNTDSRNEGVLLPQHLPVELANHIVDHGGYNGPSYVAPPRREKLILQGARNLGV